MNQEKVKVGIIGLGKMGILHSSLLSTMDDVEIVALCDKGMLIRKVCKKIFQGVHVVSDLDGLAELDLDAVFVTTPIPTHFAIVKTLFSKQVTHNLFVEKTLASSYEGSRTLCELASSGSINMVGYMKRYLVTFCKAKDLLDKGVIGKLISFDAYGYSSDFSETGKNVKAPASRGGVLRDLGAHVVDIALWYFGDFHVDSAHLTSLNVEGFEDSAQFGVTASEGLKGVFDISWYRDEYRMPEFGLTILGTKGMLKVNDDEVEYTLQNGSSQKWYRASLDDNVPFLSGGPEYFREDRHFILSILNHTSSEPDFKTASKVDEKLDQVKHRSDDHE